MVFVTHLCHIYYHMNASVVYRLMASEIIIIIKGRYLVLGSWSSVAPYLSERLIRQNTDR